VSKNKIDSIENGLKCTLLPSFEKMSRDEISEVDALEITFLW